MVTHPRERPLGARILYALKPASWPKLLVPALFGVALGTVDAPAVDARAVILAALFTVFDTAFIVLLNDWGDREVDAIKRHRFPDGCSPKTIPDGILSAHTLLGLGLVAAALGLGVALAADLLLGRPHALALAAAALGTFVAYSLPPVRLNYRGGGELLEALGVGALLPALTAYLVSGRLVPSLAWLLVPHTLWAFSSALASGLSDEESDREGGKTTFTTRFGNVAVRRGVEVAVALGLLGWAALALALGAHPAWLAVLLGGLGWPALRSRSRDAITRAFKAQGRYKQALHAILWRGTTLTSMALLVWTWARR